MILIGGSKGERGLDTRLGWRSRGETCTREGNESLRLGNEKGGCYRAREFIVATDLNGWATACGLKGLELASGMPIYIYTVTT